MITLKAIDDWARVERVTSPVKMWVIRRMADRTRSERLVATYHNLQPSQAILRLNNLKRILKRESRAREYNLQVNALMKLYPLLTRAEIEALLIINMVKS